MVLLPKHRPPTPPGRLLQHFLEDYELTQTRLADLAGMQLRRVNEILKTKRAVTPDTALRLARFFDTTPDLWINAQAAWDLWHARQKSGAAIEKQVTPLAKATGRSSGGSRSGVGGRAGSSRGKRRVAPSAAAKRIAGEVHERR